MFQLLLNGSWLSSLLKNLRLEVLACGRLSVALENPVIKPDPAIGDQAHLRGISDSDHLIVGYIAGCPQGR